MDPNEDIDPNDSKLSIFQSGFLLELPSSIGGEISHITTFKDNLYIGTTQGKLAHYYQFEDVDEYILLSQFEVSPDQKSITKMLILPNLQRLLVLSGTTATMYSLPELSPVNIGKLKDINDFLLLSYSLRANVATALPTDDKIIVFSPTKIRILSIKQDLIRLAKDINYNGSLKGVSTASKMSSNFSNLVLVANHTNYDIIDMQNSRKIPLFEYNHAEEVLPYIIPYKAEDNQDAEEYILTIKSDESTSIAMFINSLGDVTRGTISFMGYPESIVVAEWPYVMGIFNSDGSGAKLSISSLVSLNNVETVPVENFLNIKENNNSSNIQELATETDENPPSKVTEEPPSEVTEEPPSVVMEDTPSEVAPENLDSEIEPSASSQEHAEGKSGSEVVDTKEKKVEIHDSPKVVKSNLEEKGKEVYGLCNVSGAKYKNDQLNQIFAKVNLISGEVSKNSTTIDKSSSNVLIYGKFKIWIAHVEDEILQLQQRFQEALTNDKLRELVPELVKKVDQFDGESHRYIVYMTTIALLYTEKFDKAMGYLLRFKDGELLVDPQFLLYVIADIKTDGLQTFSGIYQILQKDKFHHRKHKKFLSQYLEKIYPDLISEEKQTVIREYIYSTFKESSQVIRFIEESDSKNWNNLNDNAPILNILKEKKLYFAQLHTYGILLDSKADDERLLSLFCALGINLLSKKLEDKDFAGRDTLKLVDQILYQLKTQTFDKELYAKYLLEILKLDQGKGFEFMIENKKHMHSEMHKKIMNDIPQSQANALDFSLLRIEYLESSFVEDKSPDRAKVLLKELLQVLTSDSMLSKENTVNLQILSDTYKLENSLADSKWPKISWIGYLFANLRRSEAKQLIELYLKAFELFLYLDYHGIAYPIDSTSKLPELDYFSIIQEEDSINKLLIRSDFSSAEYFAVHGHLPFPLNRFYFQQGAKFDTIISGDIRKANLKLIFDYYIQKVAEDILSLWAVRHFIQKYGNTDFSLIETLKMLPEHIPLVYITEFLNDVIIDLSNSGKMINLQKALNKADSKFTQTIYNDLNEPNAYI